MNQSHADHNDHDISEWMMVDDIFKDIKLIPSIGEDFDRQIQHVYEKLKRFLITQAGLDYDQLTGLGQVYSCGHIFEKDELVFHCRDCAMDETCVLCVECFKRTDHEGHKYRYYPSRGEGGCCDCGELESWKKPLSCLKHYCHADADDEACLVHLGEDKVYLFEENLKKLFNFMTSLFKETCINIKEPIPSKTLALMNDEEHSFEQVISVLMSAGSFSRQVAAEIARIVDLRGFAPLAYYGLPFNITSVTEYEFRDAFSAVNLSCDVWPNDGVWRNIALHTLLLALLCLCEELPQLRYKIVKATLNSEDDDGDTFGSVFFAMDFSLWKQVRKTFQQLLTMGLAFLDIKRDLLKLFEKHSRALAIAQTTDPREGDLSLLHFGVQILTVPSIAKEACMDKFPRKLCRILQKIFKSGNVFQIDNLMLVPYMIRYICNDEFVKATGLLYNNNLGLVQALFSALLALHGRRDLKNKLKKDQHVLFDSPHLQSELDMTVHLLIWLRNFIETFPTSSTTLCASVLGNAINDASTAINAFHRKELLRKELYGKKILSKKVYNFVQPAFWLLGLFVERLLIVDPAELMNYPMEKTIAQRISLNISILIDMKQGVWVRNGAEVMAQVRLAFLGGTAGHINLYLCILASFFMQKRPTFNIAKVMLHQFGLDRDFDLDLNIEGLDLVREQACTRLKAFLPLLIQMFVYTASIPSNRKEYIRHAIIQALATGPMTFTSLPIIMAPWVDDDPEFDILLDELSTASLTNDLTESSKFVLKPGLQNHYNPYYWYYSEESASKSLSYMSQRFKFTKITFAKRILEDAKFGQYFNQTSMTPLIEYVCKLMFSKHTILDQCFEDFLVLLCMHHGLGNNNKNEKNEKDSEITIFRPEYKSHLQGLISSVALEEREMTAELCEKLFVGFRYKDQEDANDDDDDGNKDTRSKNLKRLFEEKKKQMLAGMKANQIEFASKNVDVLGDTISGMILDADEFVPLISGTCIYCQEPADGTGKSYGVLGYLDNLKLVDRDGPCLKGDKVLTSCFHLIHTSCFEELEKGACPLCGAPASIVLPIVFSNADDYNEDGDKNTVRRFDDETIANAFENVKTKNMLEIIKDVVKRYEELDFVDDRKQKSDAFMMKEEDKELFAKFSKEADFEAILFQNLRQAIELYGTPEYSTILKTGKLLVNYIYALDVEIFTLGSPMESMIGFYIRIIQMFYLPERMTLVDLEELIVLTRALIITRANRQNDADSKSVSLEVTKCLCYLLSLWLDSPKINDYTIDQFLGKSSSNDDDELCCILNDEKANISQVLTLFETSMDLLLTPILPAKYASLAKIPEEICEYYMEGLLPPRCTSCTIHRERTTWFICLFCNQKCCSSSTCIDNIKVHMFKCRGDRGIFLLPSKSSLLLICEKMVPLRIPAPYLDPHGGADLGFRTGGPLFLSKARYDYLRRLWISGGLKTYILRHTVERNVFIDFL